MLGGGGDAAKQLSWEFLWSILTVAARISSVTKLPVTLYVEKDRFLKDTYGSGIHLAAII